MENRGRLVSEVEYLSNEYYEKFGGNREFVLNLDTKQGFYNYITDAPGKSRAADRRETKKDGFLGHPFLIIFFGAGLRVVKTALYSAISKKV